MQVTVMTHFFFLFSLFLNLSYVIFKGRSLWINKDKSKTRKKRKKKSWNRHEINRKHIHILQSIIHLHSATAAAASELWVTITIKCNSNEVKRPIYKTYVARFRWKDSKKMFFRFLFNIFCCCHLSSPLLWMHRGRLYATFFLFSHFVFSVTHFYIYNIL